MKRLSMLALLVSVFAAARTTSAEPKAAKAAPASLEARTAAALVDLSLVEPLAAKERDRSRFSRASLPAQARRVRIIDEQPRKDAVGGTFMRFAVDARHGIGLDGGDESQWRKATITGCVYLDRSEVYVQRGDQYRPAAFLLGKNLKPAAEHICQGDAAQVAQSQ